MQVLAGAEKGGAETFFVSLAQALHKAGLEQLPVIRHNPQRAQALRDGGLEPVELSFGGRLDILTPWKLRQLAKAYAPDIVLTWMNRASGMMPAGQFLRLARLGGFYDLKYYQRCDHLFCITPKLVEHCVAGGWPREKVHYMPNFGRLEPGKPIARASLDTPDDVPLIFALGRLHRAKAFDVLLKALAIEPRPYLWLAGEGPLEADLKALAADLGLTERIRFLGWRTDRGALFASCDICVFPSRYEPFGSVSLEAWAAERPLIAAASDGPAGLIHHEQDGLVVPIDDAGALAAAVTRLLDAPEFAARLVTSAKARYDAEFSEAACVERYMTTFERLLAEHNKNHE